METHKELFDFISLFIGLSAIGIYVLFSKLICDKKISTIELKFQREIEKLSSEKKELETKYYNIKSSQEKLLEVDNSLISDFLQQKKTKLINENDKLINDLFNLLIKDYLKKSCIKLEDPTISFEEKYSILVTIDNLKEYDIFDSSLIKSLVIAIIYSKRYLLQEKIVDILKKIDKPLIVNNAILDYYTWTNHDSLDYLISLLEYTWDEINTNRLNDLIDSLKNRESKVLLPLRNFRKKYVKTEIN